MIPCPLSLWCLLLSATVASSDDATESYVAPPLPADPAPAARTPRDCAEADFTFGKPRPVIPDCDGVLIRRGLYTVIDEWAADSRACKDLYRVATGQLALERDLCAIQRDWYRERANDRTSEVLPASRWNPSTAFVAGTAAGIVLTVAVGVVVTRAWDAGTTE